jgi:hypothetical protein
MPPQPLDDRLTDGVDGAKVCLIIGGDPSAKVSGEVPMGSADRGCIGFGVGFGGKHRVRW